MPSRIRRLVAMPSVGLMAILCLWLSGVGNQGLGAGSSAESTQGIINARLLYSSDAINEVPFFLSKSVAIESGDNKNDFLVFIPMQNYEPKPVLFRNQGDLREMENPRPDSSGEKKIVFSAIGGNGRKGIYLIDGYDPYSFSRLKAARLLVDGHNNWHPSLNSAHGLLAYVSDASGSPQIYLSNLKTKQSRQLTNLKQALSPMLDADAQWIYFAGVDQKDNYDIYRIKADGSGLARLTSSPEIEKYPTLTKYGRWIVYERGTKSARSIWVMSIDGAAQKRVSSADHWAAGPCMNAEGNLVLFEGRIGGKAGIYLADVPEDIFRGATAAEFSPGLDVASQVVNLRQFGDFTEEELSNLSQFGFLVVPTHSEQLFYTYEENEYNKIPSFVTADNLLQLLHLIFNTSLKKNEENQLLKKLIHLDDLIQAELAKRVSLKNDPAFASLRQYFGVLYYWLHKESYPQGMNEADRKVVQAELGNIKSQRSAYSAVFQTKLDYSIFKIRGHYGTSAALRRYFMAMSWLAQIPFETKTAIQRQRLLLTSEILNAEGIKRDFNDIYRITCLFSGGSDDANFYDLAAAWRQLTGKAPAYAAFDDQKMQKTLTKLFADHQARIKTYYRLEPEKNKTNVLYIMGPRYVVDSHLFSLLFAKVGERYLPGGLDLFAALGNKTASSILLEESAVTKHYPDYPAAAKEGREIMAGLGEKAGEPLFNQWLHLLKIYANSQEKAAPAVFQTGDWQRKKLNTALASWAELKHDTILYGKQSGAECGGGDEPPKVYGYIEPAIDLYRAMRSMLGTMNKDLAAAGASVHNLDRMLNLIDFFILISDKELKRIPLNDQENEQLRIIGGLLEANTIEALGDPGLRWFEITSENAKNMAVVADILTYWGRYLEEGVGYADDIYIIVPVYGQLYMMRGSIFSYYEFLNDTRLSDPEWYSILKGLSIKERAKWWQRYLDPAKASVPAPADPYDSGC